MLDDEGEDIQIVVLVEQVEVVMEMHMTYEMVVLVQLIQVDEVEVCLVQVPQQVMLVVVV